MFFKFRQRLLHFLEQSGTGTELLHYMRSKRKKLSPKMQAFAKSKLGNFILVRKQAFAAASGGFFAYLDRFWGKKTIDLLHN